MKTHIARIQPETAHVNLVTTAGLEKKAMDVFGVVCSCGYTSPYPHLQKSGAEKERRDHLAQAAGEDGQ